MDGEFSAVVGAVLPAAAAEAAEPLAAVGVDFPAVAEVAAEAFLAEAAPEDVGNGTFEKESGLA